MKVVCCFFLLLSNVLGAQTLYQEHLPKALYEHVTQVESIDEELSENLIIKQFVIGQMDILIDAEDDDNRPIASVDLWLENPIENFHGVQVGYRNGRMLGYAVFDGAGRDYVAFGPFPSEDESKVNQLIIDLMSGNFPE